MARPPRGKAAPQITAMTDSTDTANRRPLDARSWPFVQGLAKSLVIKGVKPNQISLLGIGFAVVGFAMLWGAGRWSFYPMWLILAAVCVLGRLLCNVLDGLVAIEGGLKSKGGDLWNEMPDRIEDMLFFIGTIYASYSPAGAWCAGLAVFTAYVRAFGASLGYGQDFGGPCAKQHRMFFLVVALLVAAVLPVVKLDDGLHYFLGYALWAIAAGTAVTAWLRIQRIYQKAA